MVAALLSSPDPSTATAVPRHFFGVVSQTPMAADDFDRLRGVAGTLRVPLYWSEVEPRRDEYRFDSFDRLLSAATAAGVRVLPFVYGSPAWLKPDPAIPPLGPGQARAAWSSFLRRLVVRYGPGGEIWKGRARRMPIRHWQIWNEPNFRLFWRPRPSPSRYAALLKLAAAAIRKEDPGATVVAAGVAPVEGGMLPWIFLKRLYRAPGVSHSFDTMAIHPYSSTVAGVASQIRAARSAMAAAGDGRTPLRVTEVGVASGGPYPNAFDRGRRGQARFLRDVYELLLRNRRRWRIDGVDWFAWRDLPSHDSHCVFCQFAGLLDSGGRPKPSWSAYRSVATPAGPPGGPLASPP